MINNLLKFCFYLLFLVTPLLFTSLTSELFEYNKMMFVYALTIITCGLWLLKMVSLKQFVFKRTPLDIPIALFLLSQILSTIFSIDSHTSIWGYYSRSNGGLLSIISYILLYYSFVSNFEKTDVIKSLKAAVFGGVATSLYAIPEHFGISPSCVILTNELTASCWVQDVQARVFGTLGQPNWLAAYLAMLIFPAIYLLLTAKNTLSRISYLVSLILMYLAFTFTYSRGATLGLIAGFGVFLLSVFGYRPSALRPEPHRSGSNEFSDQGWSVFSQSVSETGKPKTGKPDADNRKLRTENRLTELKLLSIIAFTFIAINIYFGSALSSFKLEGSQIAARPSIIQPSGGTQLENGGTESGQIRLIVWKGAWEIFKAYPLFGSGVETFAYSYYQFRPPEHNMVSEWDFLYNKAHNEYLNYLATTGIIGFLSYLAIIITFIVFCIKGLVLSIKGKNPLASEGGLFNTYPLILIPTLLAGYTSYLVQNFFLFSVVNVALLFYLFPAFAFVSLEANKSLSDKNPIAKLVEKYLELVGRKNYILRIFQGWIILTVIILLFNLSSLWKADTYYKKGSDYSDLNNPGRAYTYLIQAVKLNQKEPLYLSELGNAAASSSIALAQEDSTTSAELKDDAQFFTDLALSISPVNTTVNRTAIRTYFSLALFDPALQGETLQIVDKSIALSPTDPKLLHNKGIILSQFDKINEATAALNLAINMKPDYRDARLSLADIYIKENLKDLAQSEINEVLKQIPGDPDALKLQEQIKNPAKNSP